MTDNVSRMMLCLAALDLPAADLNRLITDLRTMPREEVLAQVAALRRRALDSTKDDDVSLFSRHTQTGQFLDDSVGERVERLLRIEAGLTNAKAAEELASRLTYLGLIQRHDIPQLSKKSLRDWVLRLAQLVPAKEILRSATILRNEYVHAPVADWTLSGS